MEKMKLVDIFELPKQVLDTIELDSQQDGYKSDFYDATSWILWPPSVGLPAPELPEWGVWEFMHRNASLVGKKIAERTAEDEPSQFTHAYRLKELAKGWTDDPSKVSA